ncbi:unnamed protein product (macronuclear) [Paramecium tetraurelia]|uniref:Cyclin-like domain-containing protein n=1 Tax=Paramecium tetraurelia TaxID=5888 RepID=A0DF79_PARTE|nr:uncharacterized protein GSPATT00016509001 [Paramecium tetraurelia]CAK81696.1 unnamed protein product [Paramecium tetraurelia]|eukprot:XP_001449093.1 hypothetical protein (macronuclear) [Paramecium tetraurelia strain d4-2]
MKQPLQSRLIIQDARRKSLSAIAFLDPSPKQITIRKAPIEAFKNKENININETQKNKTPQNANIEDIRRQINQPIKRTTQQQKTKQKTKQTLSVKNKYKSMITKLLYQKEQEYRINPLFFDHQTSTTPIMRSILFDWISEVCKEFTLKRETFPLCVHNLDRYISKIKISKQELQLLGLASLSIACKTEEIYPPKINDFSQAKRITYAHLTKMVDKSSYTLPLDLSQLDIYYPQPKLQIKQPTQNSYTLFRHYITLLDCAILDIKLYQFSNREIVASLLYLVLLKQFSGSTYQRIVENKLQERDLLDFQHIYTPFIELVFGFQLTQLAKCIKYLTKLLTLDIIVDQHGQFKVNAEREFEEAYENFLSIQTHNPANLQFIRQ